ncbi:HAMP domain-containing sensor histidine kinase [Candidatus Parabeggiatoa sp. HSG14]|uniref:sensor histidine kinase n=1 Tax=Candidatus Parabeggiatoa sp. HSG14 TaxID=3055593 RepID=UPI0025A8F38C|nr:HAMP domain-containing sensor histidine kinase [Thiotrichales bacterium HSG14]
MFHHSTLFIPPQHEHRLLGLMLITLHIALWWDFFALPFDLLLRFVLLTHFGVFILWQPLWSRLNPHRIEKIILLSVVISVFIVFPNIWLLTLWQILLLGLMGGRDLVKPFDKIVNIVAIVFLSLELFIVNLHELFIINMTLFKTSSSDVLLFLNYGLLCVPFTFLFISTDESREHRYYVDFFHGLTVSMLITIMALGSLVIHYMGHISLPLAIFQISLVMVVFFLTVSWLWMVFAGEESVDLLWTRHLLNIGSTFEQWLEHIAQPSHYKNLTPQEFLRAGFEQLVTLPWISGIAWHSLYDEDILGHQDQQKVVITVQSIEVTIYAHYRIGGSHYFQIKILIQLLEYFHQAKRREAAFAQQAHLQAIHETGAKLTHDIKNLLQSLHIITSAIETCQPAQLEDTQQMMQGQLAHLTQRLKRTLDKLQKPAEFSYSNVPVSLWWSNLRARYRKSHIDFFSSIDTENVLIPEDLFDNVSENLLQNALMKRKREPDINIEVSLYINQHSLKLTVCDDGSPIPDEIFIHLFTQPVSSRDGFGIGLYHVAKHLAHTGYRLNISKNIESQVCFELTSAD